jgi:hypothetical protein
MWVIVRREVHTSIPYIYIREGRFHYNNVLHSLGENKGWTGMMLGTGSIVHACRKEKTQRLTAYGHVGVKRSLSTNAHKSRESSHGDTKGRYYFRW